MVLPPNKSLYSSSNKLLPCVKPIVQALDNFYEELSPLPQSVILLNQRSIML
jgi:hypothetical protein